MSLGNILSGKKTTIVGLLVGFASILKATGILSPEIFGALAGLIPHVIDFAAVVYLLLSKDAEK